MGRRVLTGEFDKKDNSVRHSLYVGLRKNRNPECVRAVEHLKKHKDFTKVAEFVFKEDTARR